MQQPACSARLLGASESLSDRAGVGLSLRPARLEAEQVAVAARASLGQVEFAKGRNEGHDASLAGVIADIDLLDASPGVPNQEASSARRRYGLTAREVDVLRGIVERMTDREIGDRLSISPRTVGWHVTGILTKLGVESRRAAAARAIDESLT
jgi:DNA-binding NarL/FixJ family response regulator